jgi:hypothetical protein
MNHKIKRFYIQTSLSELVEKEINKFLADKNFINFKVSGEYLYIVYQEKQK